METTLLSKSSCEKLLLISAKTNQPLTYLLIFTVACLIISAVGLALDPRQINGQLAWIKPMKFSISLSLYAASLIWMSKYLTINKRFLSLTCQSALFGSIIELTAIIIQVLRGAPSHFNTLTALDTFLWYTIELAIFPVSFALLVMFVLLLKQDKLPPALGTSMRFATLLAIIGLIPGILMILPETIQTIVTGHRQLDGHIVGAASHASGLPWLGWSTVAGDLRIAHFVGLHALQVIPLAAYITIKFFPWLSYGRQRLMVWNIALSYLGFECLLMWQALHAESIVQPSDTTIFMASAISLGYLSFNILALLPIGRQNKSAFIVKQSLPYSYDSSRLNAIVAEPAAGYRCQSKKGAGRKTSPF